MNFLYNIRKLKFIFIFIASLFFINKTALSQFFYYGEPYIQNIEINEPDINSRIYSMIADSSGVILAGAHNKIYILLNGGSEVIDCQGNILLSKNHDGRIYVAGNNIFGYISFSVRQGFRLIQLPVKTGDSILQFGQAKQLVCRDSVIYLADHKHLYAIDPFLLHAEPVNIADLAQINGDPDQIWLERANGFLLQMKKGTLKEIVDLKGSIAGQNISGIFQHGNTCFIFTENLGNYMAEDGKIFKLDAESNDFINDNRFSCITALPGGNLAVGTYFGGVLITTDNGKPVKKIDQQSGLPDLPVYGLMTDSADNLWINQGTGISRLQIFSEAGFFGPDQGLAGKVNDIIRFDDKFWVATTTGCYYMNSKKQPFTDVKPSFSALPELRRDCRSLFKYRDNLFIVTTKGVYHLNKSGFRLLVSGRILIAAQNVKDSTLFYVAGEKGIREWQYRNDSVSLINRYTDLPSDILKMVTDRSGNLWLVTGLAEIYKYTNTPENKRVRLENYSAKKGLPGGLKWAVPEFLDKNGLLMITSAGPYLYDERKDTFQLILVPGEYSPSPQPVIYPVTEDSAGSLLFMLPKLNEHNRYLGLMRSDIQNKQRNFKFYPFHAAYHFPVNSILCDNNGIIWLGGKDGLLRFDMGQPLKCEKEHPFFRRITLNNDSLVYSLGGNIMNTERPVFSYDNVIRFDFGTNDYASEDLVMYRYLLEGYKKEWSGWSANNFREYTFLPPGEYRFHLQVKGLCAKLSDPVTWEFRVRPPFYLSNLALGIYIILFILFIIIILRWRHRQYLAEKIKLESIIEERTELLTLEKEKSDKLLANVFPKNTADELMMKGKASSKKYRMVTVLFSDIQGFTQIAESMNPEALVDQLDSFFFHFDTVVGKYNIEKIKTIGDAYMCAGGIPNKNRTNPVEVVLAALEMQDYMKTLKKTNKNIWDLRIGIHSGAVIAGVVGQKKLSYDIWGDTVNTASRMESSGEPGKINISENTYEQVKDFFICEYRGKMPVKYKGEVDMYFVKGIRPELSVNLKSIPNKRFNIKLQLLRLADLEELIFDKWRNDAPPGLFFHNLSHVLDVYTTIELLGKAAGLGEEEMLIIRTTGLLLHSGYLFSYSKSRGKSIRFARETLPDFKYDPIQIERICSLLKSSDPSNTPASESLKIISDAETIYFGRVDFPEKAMALYKEMREHNEANGFESWKKKMKQKVSMHEYYTHTASVLREVNKTEQISKLMALRG